MESNVTILELLNLPDEDSDNLKTVIAELLVGMFPVIKVKVDLCREVAKTATKC